MAATPLFTIINARGKRLPVYLVRTAGGHYVLSLSATSSSAANVLVTTNAGTAPPVAAYGETGGRMVFAVRTGTALAFYSSDGTVPGTVLLGAAQAFNSALMPSLLAASGSRLFVSWFSGGKVTVFASNGSKAGSGFAFSAPAISASSVHFLFDAGNASLFAVNEGARAAVYGVKGTAGGALFAYATGGTATLLNTVNGHGIIATDDGTSFALYGTDGTKAGTVKLESLQTTGPGATAWLLNTLGGRDIVVADDAGTFYLYGTDGTAKGTQQALRYETDSLNTSLTLFGTLNKRDIIVIDDDGVGQLYATDGTRANTQFLAEIDVTGQGDSFAATLVAALPGRDIISLAETGGGAFGAPLTLYGTDGTFDGTSQLATFYGSQFLGDIGTANGKVLVAGSDINGNTVLIATDGTAKGTVQVFDIANGSFDPPVLVATLGKYAIVRVEDQAGPGTFDLYSTDGTAKGTAEIFVSKDLGTDTGLGILGTHYLYASAATSTSLSLCAADGTKAGTTAVYTDNSVSDVTGASVALLNQLAPLAGVHAAALDLVAINDSGWLTLVATDGTAKGSQLLLQGGKTGTGDMLTLAATASGHDLVKLTEGKTAVWYDTQGTAATTHRLAVPPASLTHWW